MSANRSSSRERRPLISEHDEEYVLPSSSYFKPQIKIMSSLIAVCSILFLLHLFVTYMIILNSQLTTFPWRPWDHIGPTGFLACVALIFSVLNLNIWIPIGINASVDGFLAVVILYLAPSVQWYIPRPASCNKDPIYEYGLSYGVARRWIASLMVFGAFLALIVGICHLLLFVLRIVAAFRGQFWRRSIPLRVPGGSFSIEIKMKNNRYEEENSRNE